MEIPRCFMWLKARGLIFPSFIMRVLLLASAGFAHRASAFSEISIDTVHAYSIWRKPWAKPGSPPGRILRLVRQRGGTAGGWWVARLRGGKASAARRRG